jgi:hypothetical protein
MPIMPSMKIYETHEISLLAHKNYAARLYAKVLCSTNHCRVMFGRNKKENVLSGYSYVMTEVLHNLSYSSNITKVIKHNIIRWAGYVAYKRRVTRRNL